MASWFYLADGRKVGPVSEDELANLFSSGRIAAAVSVQAEGEDGWSRLDERLPRITGGPAPSHRSALAPPPNSRWTDTSPHPWRRYLARMIDNTVVGTVTWLLIGVFGYNFFPRQVTAITELVNGPGGVAINAMLTIAASIPGNALILGLTGVSLGKWIFGVKVVRPDGRPIGVPAAFMRELQVWVRGLAFGIPLVSLGTLVWSFNSLLDKRYAPWDRPAKRVAVYRSAGLLQTVLMVAAVLAWIALTAWVRFGASNG